MSLFYRPQTPSGGGGDGPGSQFTGSTELSYGGLSASVESQLTFDDVTRANQFFQPVGAEAHLPSISVGTAESTALSAKAVAAMPGGESLAMAVPKPGVAEVISPVIQLIMRLPGALGVGQSFFEFLSALFMPGKLLEAFNPALWAGQLKSGLGALASGTASGEHFAIPLSLLPANAPIWQQLGIMDGRMLSHLNLEPSSLSGSGISGVPFKDSLNISGPLDLKKAQFEGVPSGGASASQLSARHDGLLSGPHLNQNLGPGQIAGVGRIFSDKVGTLQGAGSGAATPTSTIISSASVPAGASSLNIGSNLLGQPVNGLPTSYNMSEGTLSGPSLSTNIGYELSGTASPVGVPALKPSGAVSDTLGGQQLLASNDVPGSGSMTGGYYNTPEMVTDTTPAQAGSSGLTPLRAEALSLKGAKSAASHSRPIMDHQGHQTKGIHHHGTSGKAVDQVSHRTISKAYSHSSNHAQPANKSMPPPRPVTRVEAQPAQQYQVVQQDIQPTNSWAQQPAEGVQQGQFQDAGQPPQAPSDAPAAGNDAVPELYRVQTGDNLWDIARKHLGDGTRWTEIYRLNADAVGANPHLIHPGLELKMPGAGAVQTADAGYVVQPGDNLWDIARKNLGDGTKWGELYKANAEVIGDNPRLILPGQQLNMPGQPVQLSQAPAVDPSTAGPVSSLPQPSAGQSFAAGQPAVSSALPDQTQLGGLPGGGDTFPAGGGYSQSSLISQNPPGNVVPVKAEAPLRSDAAVAATLDEAASRSVVSPSLAPDLSFLGMKKNSN